MAGKQAEIEQNQRLRLAGDFRALQREVIKSQVLYH
jgi:hypothetical protein